MAYTPVSQRTGVSRESGYAPVSTRLDPAAPIAPRVSSYTPVAQRPAPAAPVIPPPEPTLFSKAVDAAGRAISPPDPMAVSKLKSSTARTLAYLPSEIVRNLPFGLGEIVKTAQDEPETFDRLKPMDFLKAIPEVAKEYAKYPLAIGANFYPKPLSFDIPGLGTVTNRNFNAAQRLKNGEDPVKVAAEEGAGILFDALFLLGMTSSVISPRGVVIKKGPAPEGVAVRNPPKSFRAYEQPTGITRLPPEVVQKMAVEQGVSLGPKYDPKLPTYFRMRGKGAGEVVGEVVQIKPSYLDVFLNKLKSNFSKVPEEQIVPLILKQTNLKALENAKANPPAVPIVPPVAVPAVRTPPAPVSAAPTVVPPPVASPITQPSASVSKFPVDKSGYATYKVTVDGQELTARFNPDFAGGIVMHVEFIGPKNNPVSHTGYLSEFVNGNPKEAGITPENVQGHIQKLAESIRERNAKTPGQPKYIPVSKRPLEQKIPVPADKGLKLSSLKDRYYVNTSKEGFMPIQGKKVEVEPGVETFVHHPVGMEKGWTVSEARSGRNISGEATKTQSAAIEKAKQALAEAKKAGTDIKTHIENRIKEDGLSPKYTQKEQVKQAVEKEAKTIKQVAQETGIKEPNIRRILGVGTKEGTFERVDDGVYILNNGKEDVAFVHTADAVEALPRLAAKGLKVDMVFLDIPYDTPAVKGGNRGVKYDLLSVSDFKKVMTAVSDIVKDNNTPVYYMFSQAESGMAAMMKYNDVLTETGFKPVARGDFQKLFQSGKPVTNVLGKVAKPEGILLLNKSGVFNEKDAERNLDFSLRRPKGYSTEKPAELLRSLILQGTKKGGTVLDPFAGSGVTGAEAVKAGRKAVLIEKNPEVVKNIIEPRVKGAIEKPVKELEGETSEASLAGDLTDGGVSPAKTPAELVQRIEQLNKFGQSYAILRRTGGLSKKAAGMFRHVSEGAPNKRGLPKKGQVHLQNEVVKNQRAYMTTLAHELTHALEKQLTGDTNKDTFKVFGRDLTPEIKAKIRAELKEVTNAMVGKEKAEKGAGYYYKNTELLARFFERMFDAPGTLGEIAPTALEYIEKSAVENPIIAEYMQAVYGTIDKGARKHIFLRDMKQTYQQVLGNRIGEKAWNDEVRYRAMKERAKISIENLIKAKFKDIKDDPALLFQAAESIKVTKDGEPVYGTQDYQFAKDTKEAAALESAGYEPILAENGKPVIEVENGVAYERFSKVRYTPEQAKAVFDQLTPEGQKLIKDFTAEKADAKDYFNREVIKDVHKIKSDLEGWVHHYWEDKTPGIGGDRLKTKIASSAKFREGAEGYVQDLQKAMTKALTELETTKAYNDFIEDYFARVSEPIAKGEAPKPGYIEVAGNVKKGGIGRSQEMRTTVIKDGKSFVAESTRYQMPAVIYERFKMISDVAAEASKTIRAINSINRYWRVNILTHPGSAATNFISGGLQYAGKVATDFYTELLTGNIAFSKTRKDIFSMITVLTPKGWQNAPDWIYGGDLSNFYGQFGQEKAPGIVALDKNIDRYADKALKIYGLAERYWKKVIATSENVSNLSRLNAMTKEGLKLPNEEEKALLDEINTEIDLFAYDYENVPIWMEKYQQSTLGQAVKPFAKYPYKYAKMLTEMVGQAFDRTKPWQERLAKLLALGTLIGIYAGYRQHKKKEKKTPEVDETAPAQVSTRGRLLVGTDEEGKEMFVRTSKYPYLNVTEAGLQVSEGNFNTARQQVTDMIGSIGPVGDIAAALMGYSNEYQTYVPIESRVGESTASFIPGSRILNDIARFYDPYQRRKKEFGQSFTSLLPLPTASEDLREKLRGEARSIQVPIEGSVKRQTGEGFGRTTTDMLLRNYKQDILTGLLGGLYITRIDPDVAEAFVTRKTENVKEQERKDAEDARRKAVFKSTK